ncbi:MAG: hypothetical protein LBR76_00655 [Oscillospiraceae bacterium]|nr:hypothetical protein [Oscillospiraceae bacterium]
MNKTVAKILTGAGLLVVLLAVLSLTVLNGQFEPTREASFMRAGRLAAGERDYDTAIENYQMAIGLNRRNEEAYLRLSEACVYNGDVDSALYYLDKGVEMTNSARLRGTREELLASINAQTAAAEEGQAPETSAPPPPSPLPVPSVSPEPPPDASDPSSMPDPSASPDASPEAPADPGASAVPDAEGIPAGTEISPEPPAIPSPSAELGTPPEEPAAPTEPSVPDAPDAPAVP